MAWQLHEAQQTFSALVRRTLDEGPQIVTRRGKEVVVMLSIEEYRRLTDRKPDFKAFLLSGPDLSVLDLERERDRSLPPLSFDPIAHMAGADDFDPMSIDAVVYC